MQTELKVHDLVLATLQREIILKQRWYCT